MYHLFYYKEIALYYKNTLTKNRWINVFPTIHFRASHSKIPGRKSNARSNSGSGNFYSELNSSNLQWPSADFDSVYSFNNESFSPETENERNENVSVENDNRARDAADNEFDFDAIHAGRETMCERKEITYATSRVSFQRPSVDGGKSPEVNIQDIGKLTEDSEEDVVTENMYYEPPQLWSEEDVNNTDR